jgi:hypothetical protein
MKTNDLTQRRNGAKKQRSGYDAPGRRVRVLTARQTERFLRLVRSRDWNGDGPMDAYLRRLKAVMAAWGQAGVAGKVVIRWIDGPGDAEDRARVQTGSTKGREGNEGERGRGKRRRSAATPLRRDEP